MSGIVPTLFLGEDLRAENAAGYPAQSRLLGQRLDNCEEQP